MFWIFTVFQQSFNPHKKTEIPFLQLWTQEIKKQQQHNNKMPFILLYNPMKLMFL